MPGRATSRSAAVDVVIGGLRVRIESRHPALPLARLAATFRGFVDELHGRPHAWLRVEAVTPAAPGTRPRPLPPPIAAGLLAIGRRSGARPGGAGRLLRARVAAHLRDDLLRARVGGMLAGAAVPVAFAWRAGAFFGDAASSAGLLLVVRRGPGLQWPALVNAHAALLSLVALGRGGLLLHGAAIAHRGGAVVFLGRSGTGKSTVSRRVPAAALGDDGVLVLPRRGGFAAFGTPLTQLPRTRARQALARQGLPLRALLLLRHARRDRLVPAGWSAALAETVGHHLHFLALVPPALAARALVNGARLFERVPSWRLGLARDGDVSRVLDRVGTARQEHDPRRGRQAPAG
ncbi:MAG: hypothetical protein HY906_27520 [Deltaproteobacteria bacterium]|nr:hypothetical protein [Deltaproteobacteria bacterium]